MKVKNNSTNRFITVSEGSFLCNRLQLRDKLLFETHDTWAGVFKTKTHKRKLQTIEKINQWMEWYIPKKLNCVTWYCNKKENTTILKKYKEWKYTILYVVNSVEGAE